MIRKLRRPRLGAAICACWLTLSCDGQRAEHETEHSDSHEQHADKDPHDEHAEGTLRVDPGMLRDLRITTAKAELRPLGEAVTALGDLRVNEDAYAEVGSPISARITRVLASPGDKVTAGQVLAELSSVSIGQSRALVTTSAARLSLAEQKLARLRDLATHQVVSAQELNMAEAELKQAEAEHASAQQAVGSLGATRGVGAALALTSPIAGTVIDRSAVRGRLVDAEHPLFIVGDLSRLWLVVHAFERDALRVIPDAKARVSFTALPGRSFEGKVTRIGSQVDKVSRTLDVRVEVDNPDLLLRPGMSGSASMAVGDARTQTVTVPVAAVQRMAESWCVFLPQSAAGHFEVRPIGRGRDLSGEVEILTGLTAGETVIVDGAFLLKAEADKAKGGDGEHHH